LFSIFSKSQIRAASGMNGGNSRYRMSFLYYAMNSAVVNRGYYGADIWTCYQLDQPLDHLFSANT
jgi:hypothetical protein